MMNNFWWGRNGANNREINCMAWNKLNMHKSKNRMGFKSLHEFNLAMLGKQGWKLLTDSESLLWEFIRQGIIQMGLFWMLRWDPIQAMFGGVLWRGNNTLLKAMFVGELAMVIKCVYEESRGYVMSIILI